MFERINQWFKAQWEYCSSGVWNDSRNIARVRFVKTVSLTVKTFFNRDMQTRACSMTYQMMLAVVPALALIVAIGRGFGLQGLLEGELYKMFPAQHTAVDYAMNFVDSYLNASTEGVFVGVGLIFLLYTLISLFSSIEDTFNFIWDVKEGRSLGRKITDYSAMLLILPVVMVCAGGLSILLTSTLQSILHWSFMTPMLEWILEAVSWILTIFFFTLLYVLMPNTKVSFKNAIVGGIFAGIGFLLLQWFFISGQMYVAKYNAIYGSFSFLPLMLLWMQFTWIVIFIGGIICYSSQNLSQFSYTDMIDKISVSYYSKAMLAICTVVVKRYIEKKGATSAQFFSKQCSIPPRLVSKICSQLVDAGIFAIVEIDPQRETTGYQPAFDVNDLTIATLIEMLDQQGERDFIKDFDKRFSGVDHIFTDLIDSQQKISSSILIKDININIDNEESNFNSRSARRNRPLQPGN